MAITKILKKRRNRYLVSLRQEERKILDVEEGDIVEITKHIKKEVDKGEESEEQYSEDGESGEE